MELIKNIAAVVGCASACIGLLITIFKPLRQHIVDVFISKSKNEKMIKDIDKIDKKLDVLIEEKEDIIKRLDRVEKNVLDNESERLKSELFACGNRCRRGIYLHAEEFEHIRQVYERYSNVLHKNHNGTREYEFIYDYYNKQDLNNTK